jgi:hypothetical protein
MTGRNQCRNQFAANGAGGACNENSHAEILLLATQPDRFGAANSRIECEFKRGNVAGGEGTARSMKNRDL